MKALLLDAESKQLIVKELARPVPGKGEVLIKMTAAPINPSDIGRIEQARLQGLRNFIPGIEGSGVVVASGGGLLAHFWNGKRVACTANHQHSGTWAEYVVTRAEKCFPLPEKISDEQGAMHFVNPLTALAFFRIAKAGGHQAIVNLAANSALGKMVSRLGKEKNIPVINIVRSEIQKENLLMSGTSYVLNSAHDGFEEDFRILAAKLQPGLLLDPIGGSQSEKLLEIMPSGSMVLVYGTLSGESWNIQPRTLISGNKMIRGFFLMSWMQQQNLVQSVRMILAARHILTDFEPVKVRSRIGLEEVAEAIPAYLEEMSAGKIIIYPHGFSS